MIQRAAKPAPTTFPAARSPGQSGNMSAMQGDQGGDSSGNNASNGTTQNLNKIEQAVAEASTAGKPQSDDLHELSRRGFCAHPLALAGKPAQAVSFSNLSTACCWLSLKLHEWQHALLKTCAAC